VGTVTWGHGVVTRLRPRMHPFRIPLSDYRMDVRLHLSANRQPLKPCGLCPPLGCDAVPTLPKIQLGDHGSDRPTWFLGTSHHTFPSPIPYPPSPISRRSAKWCSRWDSNPNRRLRRPEFYPLKYESVPPSNQTDGKGVKYFPKWSIWRAFRKRPSVRPYRPSRLQVSPRAPCVPVRRRCAGPSG
jgi:hypothetical protein